MKFKQAVLNTPILASAYKSGLQALTTTDAGRIHCDQPRLLSGSVNIDSALVRTMPNASRWDYAIGVKRNQISDEVIWLEVHPASSTGEVDNVLAKLNWLRNWVAQNAPNLDILPREYVWVSTGPVAFSSNSPQHRRLAASGLRFAGRRYSILSS